MGNETALTSASSTWRILSSAKGAALLVRIQANPEIGNVNQTYVSQLADRAAAFIVEYCQLARYPEKLQGWSQGDTSPTTDFTSLATNAFLISVDGSAWQEIVPTLANCDTGSNTAAELQTQIRAFEDIAGFDEVTVAYDATSGAEFYKITSGRYGEWSAVNVTFAEDEKHFLQGMKMTDVYGGEEQLGGVLDREMDDALVMLVESMYVRLAAEGLAAGATIGGVSFTVQDLDSLTKSILGRRRRLWKP